MAGENQLDGADLSCSERDTEKGGKRWKEINGVVYVCTHAHAPECVFGGSCVVF